MENLRLSVSDFVALVNQTLEYALPVVVIEGEVSGFRVSQNKWVRFKLKDERSAVEFFGSVYQLKVPLEDGMRVAVEGRPRLSDRYGFSVSFQSIQPVGEGSIKKSFDLLLAKLTKEGLFDEERKRPLPALPAHIGLISSTQAAGYADFIKILNDRWGGMKVTVAHTLVQGLQAPRQISRALEHFNQASHPPEVIVIVRGGGDADDLAAFNDEGLVRAISASRIPTLVGVGHEIDTTLADLAADKRAATPSNAAQLLVPDRRELISYARTLVGGIIPRLTISLEQLDNDVRSLLERAGDRLEEAFERYRLELGGLSRLIEQLNPDNVLKRGYAIVHGRAEIGATVTIEQYKQLITAEVQDVSKK
jgi:exodeoxyribonuclease VII large subunit